MVRTATASSPPISCFAPLGMVFARHPTAAGFLTGVPSSTGTSCKGRGISVGFGRPDEADFTAPLRLLVVDEGTKGTTSLDERIRAAVGPDAEVVVGDRLTRSRRALRDQPVDCVVLGLTGAETGSLRVLEEVL